MATCVNAIAERRGPRHWAWTVTAALLGACVDAPDEPTTTLPGSTPGPGNGSNSNAVLVADGPYSVPCERLLQPGNAVAKTNVGARGATALTPVQSNDWLIDTRFVLDGGPGKDGIPALENTPFVSVAVATTESKPDRASSPYLLDKDFVVVYAGPDSVHIYPHPIMDWHEIVNDTVDGTPIALTYCPLTGTALAWSRVIAGQETTFGVSGLLFQNNVIPYDRATDSEWSQMLGQSVRGTRGGTPAEVLTAIEMNWGTARTIFPDAQVVSVNTGFARPYGNFPYTTYRTQENLLFPIKFDDPRLHRKERILGVVEGSIRDGEDANTKAYVIADFPAEVTVFHDFVGSREVVVAGSCAAQFGIAFDPIAADGTKLAMRRVTDALPVIMEDQEGTRWDTFGRAVAGPRTGERLRQADGYAAYWFGWTTFFPGSQIHAAP